MLHYYFLARAKFMESSVYVGMNHLHVWCTLIRKHLRRTMPWVIEKSLLRYANVLKTLMSHFKLLLCFLLFFNKK